MKRALITGLTGQDGTYLADLLLQKDYEVHALVRRSSNSPFLRAPHLEGKVILHHGNLRDLSTIKNAVNESDPTEVYNLAAQSHVGISFVCPDETYEVNYAGVGRVMESIMEHNPNIKIYQASTSEMFGSTHPPQNEESKMNPVSPYAKAKLKAHQDYIVGYREKHGVFACSGILFNHESPRRGENFVTRKVTLSFAKIAEGLLDYVELGNLNACRDWGAAEDYVEAMWLMLQQNNPLDFVIATGETHTVRELVEEVAHFHGISITWEGKEAEEFGRDQNGVIRVKVNKKFYRPFEVDALLGDSTKARKILNWIPKKTFKDLIRTMAKADLEALKRSRS